MFQGRRDKTGRGRVGLLGENRQNFGGYEMINYADRSYLVPTSEKLYNRAMEIAGKCLSVAKWAGLVFLVISLFNSLHR